MNEKNPCWCCGQECMFCEPEDPSCSRHWCALCKITGCEDCCGCPDCQENKRGGWHPKGVLPWIGHDGKPAL